MIVEEAMERHCDDADLFREVIEELIHACGQLLGEDGLDQILTIVENERKRINRLDTH